MVCQDRRALRIIIAATALTLTAARAQGDPRPRVYTERNNVQACLPLSQGAVLAGSRGGVVLLDRGGAVLQSWTRANGLPGTAVFSLLEGGGGIWVGTERGLARLVRRGDRFSLERSLRGPAVRDMVFSGGRLYLATWEGAHSLDPGTSRLVPIPAVGRVPAPRLTSVKLQDGRLLFGSAGQGLWRSGRGSLEPHPQNRHLPSQHVWSLASADGRLLVGTLGGVIALGDEGRSTPLSTMDARALLPLGRSALLVGSYGQGLKRWRRGHPFTERGQPSARAFVNTITRRHGTTCVGTRAGLWLKARGDRAYRRLHLAGPPSNDISALALEGRRLWVGTFDEGLASITGDRWQRFRGRGQTVDGRINALAVERGSGATSLWVATSRGVYRVRGQQVSRFGKEHGLRHEEVHAVIALRRGGVLAGTARGAVIIRGETVTPLDVKQGLPVASVWALAEEAGGALWLGTSKGLYRWLPGQRRYRRYSVSSGHLADDYVTALAIHRGAVYAGTYNSGVSRLVTLAGKLQATQLGGGWINFGGLRAHRGVLYASTMTGLRTIKPGGCAADVPGMKPQRAGACRWQRRAGAAPGVDVTAVVPAGERLWVSSRRGLALHSRLP